MYTTLANIHDGKLGSPVINPFDGAIGLLGFSQVEKEDLEKEEEKRLVTPDNPRSIYSGYGDWISPKTGLILVGIIALSLLLKKKI